MSFWRTETDEQRQNRNEECHHAKERKNWRMQNRIATCQLALGLMTVGGALVATVYSVGAYNQTKRQTKAAEDQSKAAWASIRASQRAYVTVDKLIIDPNKALDGTTVGWHAVPDIQNRGNTAAIGTKIKTVATKMPWQTGPLAMDPSEVMGLESDVIEGGGSIAPSSTWDGGYTLVNLGTSGWTHMLSQGSHSIEEMNAGYAPQSVFVWGVIRYTDTFVATDYHRTEFCFIVGRPNAEGASPTYIRCQGHNCTDEECQSDVPTVEQRTHIHNYVVKGGLPPLDEFDDGPLMPNASR